MGMSENKRLSVVVPGYNAQQEQWRRCVASVLKAIGPSDEIVCVDDGSVVGVSEKWFEFDGKAADARIRILRKENGGLSSARNAGVETARGEYIAFVDCDDEILSETFARCLDKLVSSKSDICIYGVRVVWVEEGLQKIDVPDARIYGELKPEDVKGLSNRWLFNYAWNKVYQAEFLRRHGLRFDEGGMPYEDVIFNLNCVMAWARWCSVDYVGYIYYRTGMSLLSRYKPSNIVGMRLASDTWKRYKQEFPEARNVFGDFGELTPASVDAAEKRNRLCPGSPYWLSRPYNFLRNILYVRAVRRWRLRKMFPSVIEVKKVSK